MEIIYFNYRKVSSLHYGAGDTVGSQNNSNLCKMPITLNPDKKPSGNSIWLFDYDLSQAPPLTTPSKPAPPFPSAACLPSLAGRRDVLLYFPIHRRGVCDYFYHICLQASSKPENSRVPSSSSWTEGISGMKAARLCFVATHSGGGVGQSLSPYNDLESVS